MTIQWLPKEVASSIRNRDGEITMRGLWVEGLLFEQLFTNRIEGRFELLVDLRG